MTADHWADALYDLVSIKCKDIWHMPEVRALVAEIQADASRAALERAYRNIEAVCDFADTPPEDARVPGLRAAMTMIRALLDDAAKP